MINKQKGFILIVVMCFLFIYSTFLFMNTETSYNQTFKANNTYSLLSEQIRLEQQMKKLYVLVKFNSKVLTKKSHLIPCGPIDYKKVEQNQALWYKFDSKDKNNKDIFTVLVQENCLYPDDSSLFSITSILVISDTRRTSIRKTIPRKQPD